jgi:hypothetical protein
VPPARIEHDPKGWGGLSVQLSKCCKVSIGRNRAKAGQLIQDFLIQLTRAIHGFAGPVNDETRRPD